MKALKTVLFACGLIAAPVGVALAADDVVIVYDASGSMWGQIDGVSKVEIARGVMRNLVQGWPADTNLGLVAYGHRREADCQDIETLIAPGAVDKTRFIEAVDAIRPKGRTPISAAVQHAAEALAYRDNPATVILISDGVETCQADPCALAEQLARQGVKFTAHVVGFDLQDQAHERLACIAENTGGVFVPAGNASELQQALAQVQSAIDVPAAEPEASPEPDVQAQPGVDITAPESVTAGARFEASWSSPVHPDDFVTIVPVGTEEGKYARYVRVRSNTKDNLIAPAEPGLYEVRYVLNKGKGTLGSAPVEVVEAEVGIAAPERVTAGARFEASWSSSVHPDDFVTIVPAGTEEGKYARYVRVRSNTKDNLIAPAEPGLYEVRYVLNEGKRTLASAPVEVVETEVGIAAPETVITGARFEVSWSSSVHPDDFVTIVPAGTDEGKYGRYVRVRSNTKDTLVAPAEPGLYEVRYVLNEGKRTLASASVEVAETEISLDGPDTVRAQAALRVTWSSSVHPDDFVTIVPAGADEGSYAGYVRVRDTLQHDMKAPAEPGLYEVRYVLNEGKRTLARHELEVVAKDAPLSDGVSLRVPAQASAGETIVVSWTGAADSADQRIALARADQADFSWVAAQRVGAEPSLQLKMPDQAGRYEVRYLDVSGRKVMGRAIVEVK